MSLRIAHLVLAVCESLLAVLLIAEAIRRAPVNHVGYEVCWLYAIPLLHLLLFGSEKFRKRASNPSKLIPSAVLVVTLWSLDHFNILVQYDRWIRRGMPEFGAVETR
jgi:hypothetical protein